MRTSTFLHYCYLPYIIYSWINIHFLSSFTQTYAAYKRACLCLVSWISLQAVIIFKSHYSIHFRFCGMNYMYYIFHISSFNEIKNKIHWAYRADRNTKSNLIISLIIYSFSLKFLRGSLNQIIFEEIFLFRFPEISNGNCDLIKSGLPCYNLSMKRNF